MSARRDFSKYRGMWLFALFDLPVLTKEDRKRYTRFRKLLVAQGFSMLQLSVYARYCESEESGDAYRRRIRSGLPPDGQVRLLAVTDHQFGKMEIYWGKSRGVAEKPPDQILLF